MYYAMIMSIQLTKKLPETEIDSLIGDLNSFKKQARTSGKLRGMPNHIFNIYDELEFDESNMLFGGRLRIYMECINRDDFPIDDMRLIADHYEAVIVELVRKIIV